MLKSEVARKIQAPPMRNAGGGTAAALTFLYGLSMVDNKINKFLRQMLLAHHILRCKGDADSISTASSLQNTCKADSDSIEQCRQN